MCVFFFFLKILFGGFVSRSWRFLGESREMMFFFFFFSLVESKRFCFKILEVRGKCLVDGIL